MQSNHHQVIGLFSSSNSILASQAETTFCINVPIEVYSFALTNFISFLNYIFLQKATTGMSFNCWNGQSNIKDILFQGGTHLGSAEFFSWSK